MDERPLLTVDVGNSSVAVAKWDGESAVLRSFARPEQAAALLDGGAVVLSVNAERLEAFRRAVGERELIVLDGVPLPLADPSLAETAGKDRLAAALALGPGPAIAVDAGTAVTIELVDGEGVYHGGFIAPGPAAALAGLHAAAPALPLLPGDPVPIIPGRETLAALSAGAWGLAVGGVDRLVSEARRQLGEDAPVVATGGWGRAWAAATAHDGVRDDPLLVHRGIRAWAQRA
jgi:type III pantothenate kinase